MKTLQCLHDNHNNLSSLVRCFTSLFLRLSFADRSDRVEATKSGLANSRLDGYRSGQRVNSSMTQFRVPRESKTFLISPPVTSGPTDALSYNIQKHAQNPNVQLTRAVWQELSGRQRRRSRFGRVSLLHGVCVSLVFGAERPLTLQIYTIISAR